MLRKCPPFLLSASSSRVPFSTRTGLTVKKLKEINAREETIHKIHAAMDQSCFALAILISEKLPKGEISTNTKQKLARGLAQYNPRLTPINLMALQRLNRTHGLELESIDKALILQSLVLYGDQTLFLMGLKILSNILGGPIPASALMNAVKFAININHTETCVWLWKYISEHYYHSLVRNTSLVTDFMKMFAQSDKYRDLAAKVARVCLQNASNPSIALSIAKVGYKLKDRNLIKDLLASPQFNISREVRGVLVQLDAASKIYEPPNFDLTPQELSGVVKALASRDLPTAEDLVSSSISSEQQSNDDVTNNNNNNSNNNSKEVLAYISLCNQYIEEGIQTKFQETMDTLVRLHAPSGVMLNLRLKWELMNGSFAHAKRHYQNWDKSSLKQRVIALNTLSSLASCDSESQWVANERKHLKLKKVKAL